MYFAAWWMNPSTAASSSSRRTFAGTPAASDRGGISWPSSTTAPAAMSDPSPTFECDNSADFMPTSVPLPTVVPWISAM